MKRICAIFLAMIICCGSLVYAIDSDTDNSDAAEPAATETAEPDITVNPETGETEIEVKGTILEQGKDYVLSYKNNIEVGTATVVITFIGNYAGMREQPFNIIPKPTAKPSSGGGGGGGGSSRSSGGGGSVSLASATAQPTEEPNYTYHEAYVNGYETDNGTIFKPDAHITRAEAAAMLSRALTSEKTQEPTVTTNPIVFNDVFKTDWYYDAVTDMSGKGIIKGYDGNLFRPNSKITRAELIAMLMRGREVQKYIGVPFNDVSADMWYADYIYTAYKAGYVDGYEDGSFKPDSYITRAEAVKMINGVLDRNDFGSENNPFIDVSSHWAYKDILEASVSHRIMEE